MRRAYFLILVVLVVFGVTAATFGQAGFRSDRGYFRSGDFVRLADT